MIGYKRSGFMTAEKEKLKGYLVASLLLHGGMFVAILFSPSLFPMRGAGNWGAATGASGGINATLVGSMAGIPLPAPPVVRENAVANESPGLYREEPAPPPPPPPDSAEKIPETKAPVKTPPPAKTPPPDKTPPSANTTPPAKIPPVATKSASKASKQKEAPTAPSNAVPYGQGGQPAMSYGQFPTGAGQAGSNFGTFGEQYGWYVDAINRRISQNWLKALVGDRVRTAPRVYLSFDIERNGAINNVEIKQSSGIPSLDRSAERAILASNPLPPLPGDYRGSRVNVSFYFEYVR